MKKEILVFVISILLPLAMFADYDQNISAGLKAFKENNLKLSFQYYHAAYKEKPSDRILKTLKYLNNLIKSGITKAAVPAKKTERFPWKWVLISADALALGYAVYAGADYNGEADKYDKLYAATNYTTVDNYNVLKKEDAIFNQKQGAYTAGIVVAVIFIGYTVADAFFVHAAFPLETAMSIDPGKGAIKLAVNCRY